MEGFTLVLGAAVVKSAAKLWLGDAPIAADASASAIDALVSKLGSVRDQRKLQRLFDQLEETVADRLAPLLEREFRSLDEGGRDAAGKGKRCFSWTASMNCRLSTESPRATGCTSWSRRFPMPRYVVTSRPAAVDVDWLDDDEFTVSELQPMTSRDVRAFVHRWHEAMRSQCTEAEERAELDRYEQGLLAAVADRSAIRRLAGTPLLCALLCALHRDRHGQVPDDRMALYRTALVMLLGRRDEERGLIALPGLFHTEQLLLLQDIAYWLVRNGESDAEKGRVRDRVTAKLGSLGRVLAEPDDVLRYLLERTGLLREPVAGRVDFVHRTFQEYLAAKAATESDDIGLLLGHSDLDQWHEVIVLAAGHASRRQADRLIKGLLESERRAHHLLAVAALETTAELDPDLRSEVLRRAEPLIPPRTRAAADALSNAGGFVIDLLAQHADYSLDEEVTLHAISAATQIGGEDALAFLSRFASDTRRAVCQRLVDAADSFEPEEFAQRVLRDLPVQNTPIYVVGVSGVPRLRHMRQLRQLELSWHGPEGLAEFGLPDSLTHLSVYCMDGSVFDLADLSPLRRLTDLEIRGPSANWPMASNLPALRLLRLAADPRLNRLENLSGLPQLRSLALSGVTDHRDLTRLSFLEAPEWLAFVDWPDLRDVSYLAHWADTLTSVSLADCPVTDLAPLRDLHRLRRLNVYDTGDEHGLDLSPFADLADLEIVVAPDQDVRGIDPSRLFRG